MNISATTEESRTWETRVRLIFWASGIFLGALLTYTTRYYINGDALTYIEMGEAFRQGRWGDLVNLATSPGYAVLLGIGQVLLDTNPLNELPLLKTVNFMCLMFSMAACELLLSCIKRQYAKMAVDNGKPLPWPLVMALAYSMFLLSAFNWVRPRLVAPEMAVLGLVLVSMALILRIKCDPLPYSGFALLGLCCAITYFFKTFFFPFSTVLITLAALATGSIRRAIPRALVACLAMLVVSAPLIGALSLKLGRLSYGEAGRLNYTIYVGRDRQSKHSPVLLADQPQVLLYRENPFPNATRPATFDPSHWTEGIAPSFDLTQHLRLCGVHLKQIVTSSPFLLAALLLWFIWNLKKNALNAPRISSAPIPLLLAIPGVCGVAMYCIIHVEMRYIAPFLFLLFLGLVLLPRFEGQTRREMSRCIISASLLVLVILGSVVSTVVDQSVRSLQSAEDKPSYREAFLNMVAIRDFLLQRNVSSGDDVGIVGLPPFYWGRLAQLRIIAEIPRSDQFLASTQDNRRNAVEALGDVGVRVLVAKGHGFAGLTEEGWELAPGTRDFYVLVNNNSDTPTEKGDPRVTWPVKPCAAGAQPLHISYVNPE